jgi:hypothetical protein
MRAVRSSRCAENLLPLLYAVHCDGTAALCADFPFALYSACADETAFGHGEQRLREVFGHAENFARSLVPAERAGSVSWGVAESCIMPVPDQSNVTIPPPWEVCFDSPGKQDVPHDL